MISRHCEAKVNLKNSWKCLLFALEKCSMRYVLIWGLRWCLGHQEINCKQPYVGIHMWNVHSFHSSDFHFMCLVFFFTNVTICELIRGWSNWLHHSWIQYQRNIIEAFVAVFGVWPADKHVLGRFCKSRYKMSWCCDLTLPAEKQYTTELFTYFPPSHWEKRRELWDGGGVKLVD